LYRPTWSTLILSDSERSICWQVHPACVDAVRNAKKGTTVGEVIAARENPLPPADQEEVPRNPNGVNQYTKDNSSVDNVNRPKGGNDTTYTLRRLARDNPALLDKIEAGELSVNAAAIQAGIKDDADCLAMFREAMKEQGKHLPKSKDHNCNNVTEVEPQKTGNSKAYTCERLKKQAPELFDMRHG
jgi:hypothetical protein